MKNRNFTAFHQIDRKTPIFAQRGNLNIFPSRFFGKKDLYGIAG